MNNTGAKGHVARLPITRVGPPEKSQDRNNELGLPRLSKGPAKTDSTKTNNRNWPSPPAELNR